MNPYSHLGGNPDLEVRLVHGDDSDEAWYEVPRAVSVAFREALVDAGYDAEVTLLDDAWHGALSDGTTEAVGVVVDEALAGARG